MERDPQLRHSGFFTTTDGAAIEGEPVPIDALPLHFSRTPVRSYRAPRALGADNAAILGEWVGMSEEEVRRGEAEGAFR